MTTQTPLPNRDLSYINTLKDLRKEIIKVKAEVKVQEQDLAGRMKKIPEEGMIIAARLVIPLIAKRGVPTHVFNLITNGIGLFMSLRRQKRGVQALISQAKEIILYATLGKLIKLYRQSRNRGKLTAVRK